MRAGLAGSGSSPFQLSPDTPHRRRCCRVGARAQGTDPCATIDAASPSVFLTHGLAWDHAQLHHSPADPWHSGADSHQRHRLSRDLSDPGRSGDGRAGTGSHPGALAGDARTGWDSISRSSCAMCYWLREVLQGNLGNSILSRQPVWTLISRSLPITLYLTRFPC